MPKNKPILMQPDMVRATLREIKYPGDGKTQTRRVIKPQPPDGSSLHRYYGYDAPRPELRHSLGWFWPEGGDFYPCNDDERIKCPYGAPGDLLWVRETWFCPEKYWKNKRMVIYRADPEDSENLHRWKPSIYMPRWANRITLRIDDIRAERVQDISEGSAMAEGCRELTDGLYTYFTFDEGDLENCEQWSVPSQAFRELWKRINGEQSWKDNPWVWVVRFTPFLMNIDEYKQSLNHD